MPGNFYSEAPADELRRVKAELSRERALCAGLAKALEPFRCEFIDMGLGDHLPDDKLMLDVDPGGEILTVGHWRRLMSALSELEKQA